MSATHPEEIECFRMPPDDGGKFSTEKRYEYTYATRKSWEYIPALGRHDWRYFTNKGFTYAGKWLRSERRGVGDGDDYWEVFLDETGSRESGGGHTEKTVSRDYDDTLCWRVCPYASDYEINNVVEKVMDEVVERVAARIEPEPEPVKPPTRIKLDPDPILAASWVRRVIHYIFGEPSKCAFLDYAEITTMEPKYQVHANIAEFWCFITSFFYGSSLLLYLVKKEDWFDGWRTEGATGWPDYIHFSIAISVLVMIFSAAYHASIIECIGCIDCFLASFAIASVTMTLVGVDIITQFGVLLGIGVLNLNAWRYSTRLALLVIASVYPFAMLMCMRMKSYYGAAIFLLVNLSVLCFLLDRMGIAPLHSVWHILGGGAITVALYYVVVNGVVATNGWECESIG